MLNVKTDKTTSHGRGTVYLTSTTFLFIIANYIMYVGIARILGPVKFGIYGVVVGLVTVVNGILFTWAELTTSKVVSENQEYNEGIKTKFLAYGFLLFSLVSLQIFSLS